MENSAQEANSSIGIEITGIPVKSRTRSGSGNGNEQLVIDISSRVQTSEILLSNGCHICKVPIDIRNRNSKAYTPWMSIGPYHKKRDYTTLDNIKGRYCESFLKRDGNDIGFENLETTVREMEDIIRTCYVNTFQLESDEFVSMITIDAIFILELFLIFKWGVSERSHPYGFKVLRSRRVHRDLLLLENQLPFFVIKKLYHLALPSVSNSLSLIQLTFDFFKDFFKDWNIHQKAPEVEINHFTDLLRFCALPQHELPQREPEILLPSFSATHLREAGVKFEVISTKFVPDLSFKGGVLGIPLLNFEDDTEALVLNILALEECCYTEYRYITDFYLILGCLIKTDNDVNLLRNDRIIIINSRADDNGITSMVKNISEGINSCNMNSNLLRVCEELNAFCDNPWRRWKVFLRRRYWGAVSASFIILLLLTLLQTVCSIIQMVPIVKSF